MLKTRSVFLQKIVLILFLFSFLTTAEAAKRETQTLALDNGLQALLIHDPEVHRSATALSVNVGYLYDPWDKSGLAHYLEHMLFLGTKKYPETGSYKKYLDENSGASNAYTSGSMTNYFFQSSHEGFDEAVDRFSDFFKAPLFDKKYAEREVNAVSSEHDKNKRNDGWRGSYVESLVAEKGHPVSKFGTGNKETLAGADRETLLNFYRRYYAASNMKLAMMSNLSLDKQADLVRKYFSGISNHPVQLPEIDQAYRKPLENKYRLLNIKTIKDIRSLKMDFPTIRFKDHQESKPASIIGAILGHEGKGSLLSKLKEEGLALGLSAGGGSSHPNLNSFGITVSLTRKGVEQYERVLELAFSYIRMLKEHGIEEYTYKENASMAQINFDWKDPDEGMGYVAGRAALMHDYELKDVETLPYLYRKFDLDAYRALIDTLTPENLLVILKNKSVQTDRIEKFYGTEYSLAEVGGENFAKLKLPPQVEGMHYPEVNDFIPYNLALKEEDPHLVWDDDLAKVWFQFDQRFKQPKVYMQLRIETPKVYESPRHSQLAKLYDAAVHEGLNEIVYPIQLAGLSYALSVEKKGVVLTIGGYSERVGDLLRLVTRNLKEIKIDEQKFNNLKEAMIRSLKNRKLGQAYRRGGYYGSLLWLTKQFSEEDQLIALEPLTLDDVKAYANQLYEKVYITGVAHGNWTDEKVKESVRNLLAEINSQPLPKDERFEQVVEVLNPSEKILFARRVLDNNNSISYGLQVGEKGFENQATLNMVGSLLKSDFYTQMRTNQQLGYIVWSFQQRIEEQLFLKFVIQSATYSPFELNRRVEAWMAKSKELLNNLTDEEFERHRASIIVSLEKKGDSIAEILSNLYYLATEEEGDFKFKKKMIAAVKNLRKEEVISAARRMLLDSQTPRLVVFIQGSENKEPVPPDGFLTEVSQFKNRKGDHTAGRGGIPSGGGS